MERFGAFLGEGAMPAALGEKQALNRAKTKFSKEQPAKKISNCEAPQNRLKKRDMERFGAFLTVTAMVRQLGEKRR